MRGTMEQTSHLDLLVIHFQDPVLPEAQQVLRPVQGSFSLTSRVHYELLLVLCKVKLKLMLLAHQVDLMHQVLHERDCTGCQTMSHSYFQTLDLVSHLHPEFNVA